MLSGPDPGRRVLWALCRPPARLLAAWFPYSVVRRSSAPEGAYVAVINHFSHLDPPIAALALRRPVRFLALDELWGNWAVLDRILNIFGAIPFPREARYPVGAMRTAVGHLRAGGVVAVFPEGRRVREWGDSPITEGAAWLAIKADVPLVPVALWGTQHAMPFDRIRLHRAPIRAVVGYPLNPAGYADHPDSVKALTRAVASVLDREISALSERKPRT